MALLAGQDYPNSYAELRAWFNEDWKCLDYLDWLRWPEGFVCPWCACPEGWRAPEGRWRCAGCDRRVSATAGTIFGGTREPLTVWFSAAWHLTSGKGGICATELQREMQLGSYQSAWAMLHRYGSVMVRPGRDRLTGEVEVDEAFLGGPEPRRTWARCAGQGAITALVLLFSYHTSTESTAAKGSPVVQQAASSGSTPQSRSSNNSGSATPKSSPATNTRGVVDTQWGPSRSRSRSTTVGFRTFGGCTRALRRPCPVIN